MTTFYLYFAAILLSFTAWCQLVEWRDRSWGAVAFFFIVHPLGMLLLASASVVVVILKHRAWCQPRWWPAALVVTVVPIATAILSILSDALIQAHGC